MKWKKRFSYFLSMLQVFYIRWEQRGEARHDGAIWSVASLFLCRAGEIWLELGKSFLASSAADFIWNGEWFHAACKIITQAGRRRSQTPARNEAQRFEMLRLSSPQVRRTETHTRPSQVRGSVSPELIFQWCEQIQRVLRLYVSLKYIVCDMHWNTFQAELKTNLKIDLVLFVCPSTRHTENRDRNLFCSLLFYHIKMTSERNITVPGNKGTSIL